MFRTNGRSALFCLALGLAMLGAYANHFQNAFHFDDLHTVTENPWIRDLSNVPRFFTDAGTFSHMRDHATYRPIISVSLALDYCLADGYKPLYFHLSTFIWFVVLVSVLFLLFRRIMDLADRHASNWWTAAAAAACFGLHPANAETVNYVIQRADLLATLGVAVSLLWFIAWPAQRRWCWYLIPVVAGILAKPPAVIYPLILLAYVLLFEQDASRKKWGAAMGVVLPALAVTVSMMLLVGKMTPPAFAPGAISGLKYRLTQPWIALHYFKSFFLPTELSADTDWTYVSSWHSPEAVAGYGFVLGWLAVALAMSRRRETRPISFGMLWFFLALVPTSVFPLAEVTNDHRMFFPFVGLALAVVWSLRLWLFRRTAGLTSNPVWVWAACAAVAIVLVAEAVGTHMRNEVWRTEETLWRDVVAKSPRNGRGLMNYGLVFATRGDFATAMAYFERAKAFAPKYWPIETNMGVASSGLHLKLSAEEHFERAIELAPTLADPYFYYGQWLVSVGRVSEGIARLETAVRLYPRAFGARHLLMQAYSRQKDRVALDRLVEDTLKLAPDDEVAEGFAENRANR